MRRVEDAVLAGLLVPRLSGHAVAVLANLGTQASQQALVDVASRFVNPLTVRQAAAAAFDCQRAAVRPAVGSRGDSAAISRATTRAPRRTRPRSKCWRRSSTRSSRGPRRRSWKRPSKAAARQKPAQPKRPGKLGEARRDGN